MKVNNKSKLLAVLITVVMVTALFTITSISASAMNIYIQLDVELSDDITYALDVEPNENIGNIKRMIYEETGIDIADQTLIFAGKILENDKALSDYNIQKNSTVHLYVDYFEPAVAEFVGYQVNLGGDISMKYYVKSYESAVTQEMIWVKVDFLGQTTEIRESTYVAEQDVYVFTFDGINPQCLGDDIDAELYIFETKQDEKLDYSVEDNLNGIYDEADAKTKQLIDDLRAYGKASEAYTGRTSMDGDYAVREIPVPVSSISLEDSSSKVSLHSVSVRAGSLNYMIFKFSFDEGDPHELDVKIHGKTIVDEYLDGEFYVVVSESISPEDFHQKMHITYNEDFIYDDGLINALVSINDYCAEILKDTKGDEGNYDAKTESIAQALYNYGLSAHIVKGDHVGGDGTESCTHGKACEVCGEYYGEINPDNHESDVYIYTDNYEQSTHIKVHECGVVIDESEEHTFDSQTGKCSSCEKLMAAASVTTADVSPTVTYFQDLSVACLSATNGSTVTMLKHNSSKNLEFAADNITLDLNGFSTNASISNIMSNVTIKGNGYVNGQVSLQEGGCLTILGGNYQNVTVAGGEITVYGGTFKAIYISNRCYTALHQILPEGYSFYDKNGNVIGEDQIIESSLYYYYTQTLTVSKSADVSD